MDNIICPKCQGLLDQVCLSVHPLKYSAQCLTCGFKLQADKRVDPGLPITQAEVNRVNGDKQCICEVCGRAFSDPVAIKTCELLHHVDDVNKGLDEIKKRAESVLKSF